MLIGLMRLTGLMGLIKVTGLIGLTRLTGLMRFAGLTGLMMLTELKGLTGLVRLTGLMRLKVCSHRITQYFFLLRSLSPSPLSWCGQIYLYRKSSYIFLISIHVAWGHLVTWVSLFAVFHLITIMILKIGYFRTLFI